MAAVISCGDEVMGRVRDLVMAGEAEDKVMKDRDIESEGKMNIVGMVRKQGKEDENKENIPEILKIEESVEDSEGSKESNINNPIIISSEEDDESLADATEEQLRAVAFDLLETFFDTNPALLKEVEDAVAEQEVVETVAEQENEQEVVGTVAMREEEGASRGRVYPRKCRLCGWTGSSQRELDRHKLVHAQMDRTAKCRQCGKVFFDQRDLRGHEKAAHTKEKFQCVYCDKQFRKETYLAAHLEQQHRELVSPASRPKPPTSSLLPTPSPAKRKLLRCRKCLKVFKTKKGLKNHKELHL